MDTFLLISFWLLLMDVYCTALITAFTASTPHRHPWLFAAYIPSMGIKKATGISSGLLVFIRFLTQFKQTRDHRIRFQRKQIIIECVTSGEN